MVGGPTTIAAPIELSPCCGAQFGLHSTCLPQKILKKMKCAIRLSPVILTSVVVIGQLHSSLAQDHSDPRCVFDPKAYMGRRIPMHVSLFPTSQVGRNTHFATVWVETVVWSSAFVIRVQVWMTAGASCPYRLTSLVGCDRSDWAVISLTRPQLSVHSNSSVVDVRSPAPRWSARSGDTCSTTPASRSGKKQHR